MLDSIRSRNAQWYYLSAILSVRSGNNVSAREYARQAVDMEPQNLQYRQLLTQLESGGQWYQDMGQSYNMPNLNFGDACWKLLCINAVCGCMCPGSFCCI